MRSIKLGMATMSLLMGTALFLPAHAYADDETCQNNSCNTNVAHGGEGGQGGMGGAGGEGGTGVGYGGEANANARAVNRNSNVANGGEATANNTNENTAYGGQARATNRNNIDNSNDIDNRNSNRNDISNRNDLNNRNDINNRNRNTVNATNTNTSANTNENNQNLDNVNLNVQGQNLNNRNYNEDTTTNNNEDTNTNTNTNDNRDSVVNRNNNSDTNANTQGQDQGQDQDQAQSVENVGNVHIENQRAPVNTAYAAQLTTGEDTCMGSSSIGAQAVTFGLSIGTTWQDDNCRRLKNSRQLVALGFHRAATALMCVDDDVRAAMIAAGTPCPNGEMAAAAAAPPARHYVMMAPVADKPVARKQRKKHKPLPPK